MVNCRGGFPAFSNNFDLPLSQGGVYGWKDSSLTFWIHMCIHSGERTRVSNRYGVYIGVVYAELEAAVFICCEDNPACPLCCCWFEDFFLKHLVDLRCVNCLAVCPALYCALCTRQTLSLVSSIRCFAIVIRSGWPLHMSVNSIKNLGTQEDNLCICLLSSLHRPVVIQAVVVSLLDYFVFLHLLQTAGEWFLFNNVDGFVRVARWCIPGIFITSNMEYFWRGLGCCSNELMLR